MSWPSRTARPPELVPQAWRGRQPTASLRTFFVIAFALAQGRKGIAEIVLRRGPVVRRVLPAPHLKRGAVGSHCLLKEFFVIFTLAQGQKGIAEVVLRRGPVTVRRGRSIASSEFVPQSAAR